jgi:FkbM family methyltransferase
MRHSLLHTVGNVVWVARAERRASLPLLATYARLKASELLSSRDVRRGRRRTTVLGMPVLFYDHFWLLEMFEDIFLRRQYEFASSTERPSIVDAGSNIGLAILFFKRLYPDSSILGFEPDPAAFALLKENVAANGLEGVRLVNEALSDGREELDLHRDPDMPGSPQTSTTKSRMTGTTMRVKATRLSEHLSGVDTVDFLKLDIEGAERTVLDELEAAGKLRLVQRLAIEYHHHLDVDDDALGDLLAALERSGFGYQLEARLDGAPGLRPGRPQNILVHAYRKPPEASTGAATR